MVHGERKVEGIQGKITVFVQLYSQICIFKSLSQEIEMCSQLSLKLLIVMAVVVFNSFLLNDAYGQGKRIGKAVKPRPPGKIAKMKGKVKKAAKAVKNKVSSSRNSSRQNVKIGPPAMKNPIASRVSRPTSPVGGQGAPKPKSNDPRRSTIYWKPPPPGNLNGVKVSQNGVAVKPPVPKDPGVRADRAAKMAAGPPKVTPRNNRSSSSANNGAGRPLPVPPTRNPSKASSQSPKLIYGKLPTPGKAAVKQSPRTELANRVGVSAYKPKWPQTGGRNPMGPLPKPPQRDKRNGQNLPLPKPPVR